MYNHQLMKEAFSVKGQCKQRLDAKRFVHGNRRKGHEGSGERLLNKEKGEIHVRGTVALGASTLALQNLGFLLEVARQLHLNSAKNRNKKTHLQRCQSWHNNAFWHNFDHFSIKIMLKLC